MKLQISRALVDQMIADAAKEPDREVCGLLLGHGDCVSAITLCENVAAEPTRQFEIDPAMLIAAHRAARSGDLPVIGCYHSHPNGVKTLSAIDREFFPEGDYWLLIANGSVSAWAKRDGVVLDLMLAVTT